MRIGIITEGEGEYDALRDLCRRINPKHVVEASLLTNVQFDVPLPVVLKQLKRDIRVMVATQNVDVILIVLDREKSETCPAGLANELRQSLVGFCQLCKVDVEVVVKDKKFENWLVADLQALRAHPALFEVSQAMVDAVEPNNADQVDAETVLKRALRVNYKKRRHAGIILASADPVRMAQHSRSFRRLMRVLGHGLCTPNLRQEVKLGAPSERNAHVPFSLT